MGGEVRVGRGGTLYPTGENRWNDIRQPHSPGVGEQTADCREGQKLWGREAGLTCPRWAQSDGNLLDTPLFPRGVEAANFMKPL